ncbi:hypothetical protein ACHWQZ_G018569 [Mnemiopsis leidyi]
MNIASRVRFQPVTRILKSHVFQARNAGDTHFHNFGDVKKALSISWVWKDVIQRSLWMSLVGIMGAYFLYMESEPKYNFRYSKLK